MSDFGDGLGTAIEGGLFARAIDGRAGGMSPPGAPLDAPPDGGHFAETACLNCGTMLRGPHCHQCGQKGHLHRTLGAFMHDLLHGALHFEGKIWKTLPKLALKPGELTRRYIDGERARFVSPMALFLFSIFLMFAAFQIIGVSAPSMTDYGSASSHLSQAVANLERDQDERRAALAAMAPDDPDRSAVARRVNQAQTEIDTVKTLPILGANAPGQAQWKSGWHWLDKGIAKWNDNPGLMLYKLQSNGYKFSWLLIPISIPFVWLLFFWKRRYRAYDHAIFVTYSIAFMSLFFIVLSLLIKLGAPEWFWSLLMTFVPPIHIYKQLRGAYALSRFSALWRLVVLSVFITIVITLFMQLIILIGAF